MTVKLADLLAPVTREDLIAAGVHPIKASMLTAFYVSVLNLTTSAIFEGTEPTIIERREPRPTCCEDAARCSALNWQEMTWGGIRHCPFCGVKLAAPNAPKP